MSTLCHLFDVPFIHFDQSKVPESMREVDFFIIKDENYYRCEVKLMGKGNPESADAIFARESNIFVADKLSDLNKKQAEMLNVNWVELRSKNGYMKLEEILTKLNIPHSKTIKDLDKKLEEILKNILK